MHSFGVRTAAECCRMISLNVSSALVIESDADWDMRIRSVMQRLAHGVRMLVDWPFDKPHHTNAAHIDPYGDSWDILWIGHCGSSHGGNMRMYSWNDTTVPRKGKTWTYMPALTEEQYVPGTRSVFQFGKTTCTIGYAVTLQAAKKLVKYFKKVNANVDDMMSWLCTEKQDLVCLAVWPQIMTAADTKSNIDHDKKDDISEKADDATYIINAGPGLQYSARRNARRVIDEGARRADWIPEWYGSWAVKNETWDVTETDRLVVEEA